MSEIKIARIKGSYRYHRKMVGEYVAICGAKPGVSKRHRHMKDRTGWWIYKDDFDPTPASPLHDSRCKICFKPPE